MGIWRVSESSKRPAPDYVRELEGKAAAMERSQAVIEFSLDGRVLRANANFLEALGYTEGEVVGRHHRMFVDPVEAQSPEYAELWRALNAGEFVSRKFRRIGKNGREVWIQASYNPVLDSEGKPVKVVKFATDITAIEHERARNEAERARAAAEQETAIQSLAGALKRLSSGDLTAEIEQALSGGYDPLRVDFNAAVGSLKSAIGAVVEAATSIRGGSDEIASAAGDLARRTEQQAASLEETAAALEQITATVKRTAEGARQASEAASAARGETDQSGEVVGQAIIAMQDIERSSGEITQIIGVIDEIAFQTNLLALNAGVEAARAGDAGRGFAVVAQEVRALAQRSAEAAKEIKGLIGASARNVGRGVQLVGETSQALASIGRRVAEIDELVSGIAAAAHEQSTGLGEVNIAVTQMDRVTQQNAAMVEETTAAAAQLRAQAAELNAKVGGFRTGERPRRREPDAAGLQRRLAGAYA